MAFLKKTSNLTFFILFCSYTAFALTQTVLDIPDTAKKLKNPLSEDPSATIKGFKIYKKVCWSCHGTNGQGNGPGASDLKTEPANFSTAAIKNRTDGELYWWISEGGGEMDAYKTTISDKERWMLVSYIRKIQDK